MGKIRLKTLGEDDLEKKQADEAKKRRDVKKQKKTEDDVPVIQFVDRNSVVAKKEEAAKEDEAATGKKQKQKAAHRHLGKNYKESRKKVDHAQKYSLSDGLKLVKEMKFAKFDETVELHLNLRESGVKGEVQLPHGTGKEVKVVIADDAVIKKIEAGKIDFDILIATPAMMPNLVKLAKVLGPKGLMPNPKKGTVTDKPEEAVKKFSGGAVRFQSEAKFPLMHQSVGKISFTDKQLIENIEALLGAVKKKNVIAAFVSSSMSPSVEIVVE